MTQAELFRADLLLFEGLHHPKLLVFEPFLLVHLEIVIDFVVQEVTLLEWILVMEEVFEELDDQCHP